MVLFVRARHTICDIWDGFLHDCSCRDRALLVSGSNTAKHATLAALLDPQHPLPTTTDPNQPPMTSTGRPQAFVSGVPQAFLIRFRSFSTCISAVLGVSLVGVALLSADVAVAAVRPEVWYLSEFLSLEVEQGPIGKLSSRHTRSCNNPKIHFFVLKAGFACERLIWLWELFRI
jgi:hypothetical protein